MTPMQLTGLDTQHLVPCPIAEHSPLVRVHHAVSQPLLALYRAAKTAGFDLQLASAHRDFHRQAAIWQGKWQGARAILNDANQPIDLHTLSDAQKVHAIMRWSALPGTSRHHWGCDFDLYAKNCLPPAQSLALEPWEYQQGGHQYEFALWLEENLSRFEFFLPYRRDRGGVGIEPWHVSYAPMSQTALTQLNVAVLTQCYQQHPVAGQAIIDTMLPELLQRYVYNIASFDEEQ
ncbi:hypothetical protein VST7929_02082 [Vibrio stylophorae]|uniref:D-alanyl-D-alanine carboxypeptidase-like core domain-containing protein n=1 Tax=Vibrio stylophorae TaxID=659351 RepID=A0ABN8DSV0_9VIBR|nr:M15 family metallopeptidase [Vibrio stylophorae]CAH0534174.1 hypothetical protein VST7929_02082 [Vibrio stylophorae]